MFLIHYPHCIFGVKKDGKDYKRFKGNEYIYIIGLGQTFYWFEHEEIVTTLLYKEKYSTIFAAIWADVFLLY